MAIDFFTIPTATFGVLYVFIVLNHERRKVVHFNVTEMGSMASWSNDGSGVSLLRRLSQRLARHGKIPSLNALSGPSAGSA